MDVMHNLWIVIDWNEQPNKAILEYINSTFAGMCFNKM
jgi:hypothetical protein